MIKFSRPKHEKNISRYSGNRLYYLIESGLCVFVTESIDNGAGLRREGLPS